MAVASGPAGPVLAGPVFYGHFETAHAQITKLTRARTMPGLLYHRFHCTR